MLCPVGHRLIACWATSRRRLAPVTQLDPPGPLLQSAAACLAGLALKDLSIQNVDLIS